ncbi:MAG: hypothetical protein U0359_41540 [Byssovorax sp.]
MRLNGLYIVAELALRQLGDPFLDRYKSPLVLGSLREDVWYIPGAKIVFEHLSFSHFYTPGKPGGIVPYLWPGPRMKAEKFHRLAVRLFGEGKRAAGFVQLGRVAHLITDMCCPVHAHRTVHETDPFEWWVEANKTTLLSLPVPFVPDVDRPAELIESMARFTQDFATDPTNNGIGRIMKRLGRWKSVSAKEAGEQARALIPMAAGHTAALLRLYLRDVGVARPQERAISA